MTENVYRSTPIEITAVGMERDMGLFIINDSKYITITRKNLDLIASVINPAIITSKEVQITYNEITDCTTEVSCYVSYKDNAFKATIDSKDIKITESLYDSFRLAAFIRTFLVENEGRGEGSRRVNKIVQLPSVLKEA
jgi:hypothetical protein